MQPNSPYKPNPSNVEIAFGRAPVKERVHRFLDEIKQKPDECLVPYSEKAFVRHDGRRVRASYRHLLWYSLHGDIPTFAPTACGNPGCINPAHQMKFSDYVASREIRKASASQRLSDAERRIGELEARLGVAAVHDDGSISSL